MPDRPSVYTVPIESDTVLTVFAEPKGSMARIRSLFISEDFEARVNTRIVYAICLFEANTLLCGYGKFV